MEALNEKKIIEAILSNENFTESLNEFKTDFSDLTILIPTNRSEFIRFSIRFFNLFKFINVKYVIYDQNTIDLIDSAENNIEIIEYNCKEYSWIEHFIFAAKQVSTSLVLLIGDDDFVNLNDLNLGYLFMKSNPDYSLYYGLNSIFVMNTTSRKVSFSISSNKKVRNLNSENPFKRIKQIYKNYANGLYGITRKDNLLNAYKLIKEINPENANIGELARMTFHTVTGKVFIDKRVLVYRRAFDHSWGAAEKSTFNDKRPRLKIDLDNYSKVINKSFQSNIGSYSLKRYNYSNRFRSSRISFCVRHPFFCLKKFTLKGIYLIKIFVNNKENVDS